MNNFAERTKWFLYSTSKVCFGQFWFLLYSLLLMHKKNKGLTHCIIKYFILNTSWPLCLVMSKKLTYSFFCCTNILNFTNRYFLLKSVFSNERKIRRNGWFFCIIQKFVRLHISNMKWMHAITKLPSCQFYSFQKDIRDDESS